MINSNKPNTLTQIKSTLASLLDSLKLILAQLILLISFALNKFSQNLLSAKIYILSPHKLYSILNNIKLTLQDFLQGCFDELTACLAVLIRFLYRLLCCVIYILALTYVILSQLTKATIWAGKKFYHFLRRILHRAEFKSWPVISLLIASVLMVPVLSAASDETSSDYTTVATKAHISVRNYQEIDYDETDLLISDIILNTQQEREVIYDAYPDTCQPETIYHYPDIQVKRISFVTSPIQIDIVCPELVQSSIRRGKLEAKLEEGVQEFYNGLKENLETAGIRCEFEINVLGGEEEGKSPWDYGSEQVIYRYGEETWSCWDPQESWFDWSEVEEYL